MFTKVYINMQMMGAQWATSSFNIRLSPSKEKYSRTNNNKAAMITFNMVINF
jgi:hypothetical protein